MRCNIIPRPVAFKSESGHFSLIATTNICAPAELRSEADYLADRLSPATGFRFEIRSCIESCSCNNCICLTLTDEISGDEAYVLDVTENGVSIKGSTARGVFYGIQTLLQLLPPEIFRDATVAGMAWTVSSVHVQDEPRFGWRGMHLDSARHFMPKEFVKKFIDLLALHKMNVFHWHLTEDQGWRIEIKKYPKLAEISAWREETVIGHHNNQPRVFDGRRHGGVYTQDDVREIVAYAARRHINVVPEIEMPGHSQAVLAAYPDLGCKPGPYNTRTIWGISEDVFCAGNDQVFAFLKDVLTEVMELFPSPFIHIGGDECIKAHWKKCPKCQARIKEEGLADEHELQSYFIKRIDAFLTEHGRRLIGWDEILEGGLAPNATVMSWRGIEGGIKAANAGHDVVFAPNGHTYFDYCQSAARFSEPLSIGGCLPLEKVYSYEPIPDDISQEQLDHVLGAQGQLWSEYFPNPKHVEYMAFPRLTALCEVVWSPKEGKDYDDYLKRLDTHLKRLDVLDVNYRPLD